MNMFSQQTHRLILVAIIALPIIGANTEALGQRITYKEVQVKRTIDEPVTRTRWVEKETIETDSQVRQKQIIQTEKRQRVTITQKPVTETKYRIEKVKRQKPVTVEKFRERRTKETTYKTVNGFRDETQTVREPFIETEMRTEKVIVKKPVTKELIEVQKTTTMKPVVKKETQYSFQPGQTLYQVLPDVNQRARLRLLSPGYYTEPISGATVYRRRGLHWVQPNATVPVGQTPTVTQPYEVESTTFEPEVVETRRPISVTRMVEETIEREVPHEVKKFVERTVTKKVPYEYKIPVDKIIVEKIPYTETVYEEEVIERQVPYTETRMQEVRTVEDYEVQVPRYVNETVEKQKPVRSWVEQRYETTVQRTVYETMKVATVNGEPVSKPVPLGAPEHEFLSQLPSTTTSTTHKPTLPRKQTVFSTQAQVADEPASSQPTLLRKPTTITVPETKPTATKMAPIVTPKVTPATTDSSVDVAKPVLETSVSIPSPPAAELPDSGLSTATGNEHAAD